MLAFPNEIFACGVETELLLIQLIFFHAVVIEVEGVKLVQNLFHASVLIFLKNCLVPACTLQKGIKFSTAMSVL